LEEIISSKDFFSKFFTAFLIFLFSSFNSNFVSVSFKAKSLGNILSGFGIAFIILSGIELEAYYINKNFIKNKI
jgi:hypothetical protein